eukprot:16319885-Heterocapsa_arctica.AAC.1
MDNSGERKEGSWDRGKVFRSKRDKHKDRGTSAAIRFSVQHSVVRTTQLKSLRNHIFRRDG